MTTKRKKNPKRRKQKGKRLSEAIREREESRRDVEGEEEPDDLAPTPPPRGFEEDALFDGSGPEGPEREPPPAPDSDERDEDEEEEDDEPPPRPVAEDEEAPPDEGEEEEQASTAYRTPGEVEDDEYEDEEDEEAAALLGHRRYVMAGFAGLWLIGAYVLGRTLEGGWSQLASKDWFVEKVPQLAALPHEGELVSRSSVSMVLGAILAALIAAYYFYKPDVRVWADEVAEELSKVKWPTRKEVGNNTVVVIAASAIITLYLMLLDRFWGFVTNVIYTGGI